MKAIVYFSISKNKSSEKIANSIEGDKYQIIPTGKVYKNLVSQMFCYGFMMMRKKQMAFDIPNIDFSNYDEVDLVFPIWGGKPSVFMLQYLEKVEIKNKTLRMLGTSNSGDIRYMETIEKYIDESNTISEKISYKKTEKM